MVTTFGQWFDGQVDSTEAYGPVAAYWRSMIGKRESKSGVAGVTKWLVSQADALQMSPATVQQVMAVAQAHFHDPQAAQAASQPADGAGDAEEDRDVARSIMGRQEQLDRIEAKVDALVQWARQRDEDLAPLRGLLEEIQAA